MKILDSIFIQPTFACALDCPGCYVKESTKGSQVKPIVMMNLIKELWEGNRVVPSQMTIAVDDIPKFDMEAEAVMVGVLNEALNMKEKYPDKMELHVTMNSAHTVNRYIEAGISAERMRENLDLVSFSNLTKLNDGLIRYFQAKGKVNYNYTHSPNRSLDKFRDIVELVDMSYYVLHKAGLGKTNDPAAIQAFKDGLTAMKDWPQELKDKVEVDHCVKDAFNFVRTGHGCNVNISRMQVWPDGHVTGCPYNKNGGKTADTVDGIINNILEVSKEYEFKQCTIPTDYRKKPAVLQVVT